MEFKEDNFKNNSWGLILSKLNAKPNPTLFRNYNFHLRNRKSRYWLLTWHNKDNYDNVKKLLLESGVTHFVAQVEKGEQTGHVHLQIYCELLKPRTRVAWANMKTLGRAATNGDLHYLPVFYKDRAYVRGYCLKTWTRLKDPIGHGEFETRKDTETEDLLFDKEFLEKLEPYVWTKNKLIVDS